jgi:hypothetical protein
MPESEERYFETGFKAGQVLVTVEAGARVLEAMAIFDRYGADTGPATRPGAIGGFCSLMISHHRGIFSIGLLLTCGVGSVLLAALTVLPSLLALLATNGPARSPAYAERDGLFPRAEPIRLAGLSYRASLTADRLPPIRRLDPRPVLGAGTALAADGGTPQRPS